MLIGSFFALIMQEKHANIFLVGTEKRHSSDNKRYIIEKIDR